MWRGEGQLSELSTRVSAAWHGGAQVDSLGIALLSCSPQREYARAVLWDLHGPVAESWSNWSAGKFNLPWQWSRWRCYVGKLG